MSVGDQEMLDLFLQESSEHLQTLETDLIALEANPAETSRLNSIFRAVHSIKGAAGFFGFEPIVRLAHVMESVMSLLRDGKMQANESIVSLLISTTDKLNIMLAEPSRASEVPCESEVTGLQALLDPGSQSKPDSSALKASKSKSQANSDNLGLVSAFEFQAEDLMPALKRGRNFFVISFALAADVESQQQTLVAYFRELESLGQVIDIQTATPAGTTLSNCAEVEVTLFFATALDALLLSEALGLDESRLKAVPANALSEWVKQNSAEPKVIKPALPVALKVSEPSESASLVSVKPATIAVKTEEPSSESIDPKPIPGSRRKAEETIRINVGLLDTLMNLAGEMVLGRNRLMRLAVRADENEGVEGLQSIVQEISSVTSSLQDTIMRARLQPVGGLFGKFNRIVRDLSHKLEKEIQLEIFGDDVELDRTLLEGLSDPLTHLVRNSVDHGIEMPAERVAKGKSACGLIRLSAAHLAGRVQIEVLDDGGGMDPERLKAKAIEKGIITPEQAARMSDEDALQLIFAAGFSTAEALSDISGRGVGMDVVKTNIEKLGGHVEIDSRKGAGTRIIIRLPLTLAIVPALIVGCQGTRYAIPQINVEEVVHPGGDFPLETLGGAQVLRLRGELKPVINLASILGMPDNTDSNRLQFVIVLQLDHMVYGLLVDEIVSTEEIVVKPLGRHIRTVPFYSGATLLGQGEIALILDPSALAQGRISVTQKALNAAKTALPIVGENSDERALVFQDGEGEVFAISLKSVMRVEYVQTKDIERIGSMDCLRKDHTKTLRLVRLGNVLPLPTPPALGEEMFVIVPRPPYDHIGIVAGRIVDSVDFSNQIIDPKTFAAKGVLGTVQLLGRLTLVIDCESLVSVLNQQASPLEVLAEAQFIVTQP